MATGRVATRRNMLEMEHAMNAARQMKDSHLGEVLLRDNVAEQRLLSGQLTRLSSESRRQEAHFRQQRAKFLKRTMDLPDPVLIVERLPSSEQFNKGLYTQDGEGDLHGPNYMRPTQARARTPHTIPTIDAFTVKTRRKQNIWEEATVAEKPRFHSTMIPSEPLSRMEEKELQRGWTFHQKPGTANRGAHSLPETPRQRVPRRPQLALPEATPLSTPAVQPTPPSKTLERQASPTFITQLDNTLLEEPKYIDQFNRQPDTASEQNLNTPRKVKFSVEAKHAQHTKETKDKVLPKIKRRTKARSLSPIKSSNAAGREQIKVLEKQPISQLSGRHEKQQQSSKEDTHENISTEKPSTPSNKAKPARRRRRKPKSFLEILTQSPPPQ